MANNLPATTGPTALTDAEISTLLAGAGEVPQSSGEFHRIKVDGSNFVAGDDIYVYNSKSQKPAFIGRLVGPIREYQGLYFDQASAEFANTPERADKYCKAPFKQGDNRRELVSNLGYACNDCALAPFIKKDTLPADVRKCQQRGELDIQIVPDSGLLEGTETVWTLDLSTTGMIEFQGSYRDKMAGHISTYNFKQKLAMLAQKLAIEAGENPETGILKAMTAYRNGGVVAEFRLLGNPNSAFTYRTVSLEPIAIIDVPDAPAITADGDAEEYSDLPF